MSYYKGLNEYRWEFIAIGQGHYPLHKNLTSAITSVKKIANKKGDVISIQSWKPKGKRIYLVLPRKMSGWSKSTIVSYYKDKGYNVNLIKSSKYVLK